MNIRAHVVIVLFIGSACQELPFVSHHPGSSTSGMADGDAADRRVDGVSSGGLGTSSFPGFGPADAAASVSNATEGVALDDAGAGAFSVPVPWNFDAGAVGDAFPFSFPSPTSLPPASAASPAMALATSPGMEVGLDGCGEPRTCYLRTIIATARGHVYSARMSKSYPTDSCVTRTIDCDRAVLVGDSNSRFADTTCGAAMSQITLGFLVPQSLFFSWQSGQIWESTSGFRSEWTLVNVGDDSGTYEPIPGQTAKLWPAWSQFFAGGEIYGELLVPLRHTVTHTLAIGFALFDVRVRP